MRCITQASHHGPHFAVMASMALTEGTEWKPGMVAYCSLVARGVARAAKVLVVKSEYCQTVVAAPALCALVHSGLWAERHDVLVQPIYQCACSDAGASCSVVFHSIDTRALFAAALPLAVEFRTLDDDHSEPTGESVLAVFYGEAGEQSDLIQTLSAISDGKCYYEVRLADGSFPFLRNSVLLVPDLLTKEQCHILMDAADHHIEAVANGSLENDCDETPNLYVPRKRPAWLALADSQSRHRLCVSKLGSQVEALSSTILLDRLLPFFEQHLPEVAQALFGQNSGLKEMRFSFSPGEPAVNRYTEGGEFRIHTDKLSVTLNVLLSEPGAFLGGGTAFWSQDNAAHDLNQAVLLKPRQGTGVVFNGDVRHSGGVVESGTRHLYVASFHLDSPAAVGSPEAGLL